MSPFKHLAMLLASNWHLIRAKVSWVCWAARFRIHLVEQVELLRTSWASERFHLISTMTRLAAKAAKSLDKPHLSAGRTSNRAALVSLTKSKASSTKTDTMGNSYQRIPWSQWHRRKATSRPNKASEETCLWKNTIQTHKEIKTMSCSSCPPTALRTNGSQQRLSAKWEWNTIIPI